MIGVDILNRGDCNWSTVCRVKREGLREQRVGTAVLLEAHCRRPYSIWSPELKFLPRAYCNRRRTSERVYSSREWIWPYSKYSTHALTYRSMFLRQIMCRQVDKAAFCNTVRHTSTYYAWCVRCFDLPVWNFLWKFRWYALISKRYNWKKPTLTVLWA